MSEHSGFGIELAYSAGRKERVSTRVCAESVGGLLLFKFAHIVRYRFMKWKEIIHKVRGLLLMVR